MIWTAETPACFSNEILRNRWPSPKSGEKCHQIGPQ